MPNVPAAAPPHTWAVTNIQEEATHDDNGKPTTVHHVHFKTNTGHESHISLDDKHFSAANVAAQVHHKANEIIKVAGMNSHNAPPPE